MVSLLCSMVCYGSCVRSSFNLKMGASLPLSLSPSLLLSLFSPPPPSPPCTPSSIRYKVQQGHAAKLAMGPELRAALAIQGQYRSRKTRLEVRRARGREVARTTNGTLNGLYVKGFTIKKVY